ncbi:MAG: Asp-tRNA(Asn)/Glu-tRNA(Gln) amidotransferase subunit GatA [Pseudomonadota bacterium]|nr:Asp-tRNA(Asn)/Glu-tRNA(Gln) amidotransferase subunit GatA [Pseudomonadota bacterium]
MNKDLHELTLQELSSAIHIEKSVSPSELTQHYLERIKKHNPDLNAYIHTNEDISLKQAKLAESMISEKRATLLTGIPIGQKDIFCTVDMPTTCGSKMLEGFVATYDATVIEKCNSAGLVNLGKLNMDEFAMGSTNENSAFGAVLNPWNLSHCPGGSSGGSAAAVAARIAPCATGTDTGGSIRQPAAFTGITGIKPTYGRVSRYGMVAFASSLDQAGPMTHNAYDSAMLLNVLCGNDPMDATSSSIQIPDFTDSINMPINGLKIGVPEEYFAFGLDPECEAKIQEAIKLLEKQGAIIVPIHLPNLKYAIPTYYLLAPIECASNLARFDGVHYGYRHNDCNNINDLYELSREHAFGDEVKRRILIGTFASSGSYSSEYYKKALKAKHIIRNDYKKAFLEVDVILTPTTTSTAFELNNKEMTPQQMYLSDIYTVSVNLAGLPGISFPVGFSNQGLPVGAQLIGNRFCEETILRVAHCYQQQTDWHNQYPKEFK